MLYICNTSARILKPNCNFVVIQLCIFSPKSEHCRPALLIKLFQLHIITPISVIRIGVDFAKLCFIMSIYLLYPYIPCISLLVHLYPPFSMRLVLRKPNKTLLPIPLSAVTRRTLRHELCQSPSIKKCSRTS